MAQGCSAAQPWGSPKPCCMFLCIISTLEASLMCQTDLILLTPCLLSCSQYQPSPGWHPSLSSGLLSLIHGPASGGSTCSCQYWWGGASPYNVWECWTFWFSLWWQFSFLSTSCVFFLSDLIFEDPIQADTGCWLEVKLWFNFRLIHNRTVFYICTRYF